MTTSSASASVPFLSEDDLTRCHGCTRPLQPAEWVKLVEFQTDELVPQPLNLLYHFECWEAEQALNKLASLAPDEWICLQDVEPEDSPWLSLEHPLVHARLLAAGLLPPVDSQP